MLMTRLMPLVCAGILLVDYKFNNSQGLDTLLDLITQWLHWIDNII
jgi:hypothetical protein